MNSSSKSNGASILCTIGGLLIVLGGLFTVTIGTASGWLLNALQSLLTGHNVQASSLTVGNVFFDILLIDGLIGLVSGAVVLASGIMMGRKAINPHSVNTLGAIALIFSVISLLNLGGFLIGGLLAIIGSFLALVYRG